MTVLLDFLIAGGDARMKYLEKMLVTEGYKVKSIYTEGSEIDFETTAAANIVLPVPCCRADGSLNAPYSDVKISPVKFIENLGGGRRVFGGMIPESLKEEIEKRNLTCYDYMKWEPLTIKNAQATAEGAIKIAIENTDFTICSSSVLITGYGRIGKILAVYLKALGADVTVEARKEEDIQWIKANGYKALHLKNISEKCGDFDIIFNTVPYEIFTESEIINMNKNAIYIELASLPGGIDEIEARRRKITVVKGSSLPGKTAPKTSAEAIKDALLGMLKEAEV